MENLVTLVIPVFNEGGSIASNIKQIAGALEHLDVNLEIIVVDDGSTDSTADDLRALKEKDTRVVLCGFTRNFGKEAAIEAGLQLSSGNACIVVDADLQHPPTLMPEMIRRWRAGSYVVEAVKKDRRTDGFLRRVGAAAFYRTLMAVSGMKLMGKTDFKLLDRRVVNYYLKLPEQHKFFRGLIEWASFPTSVLEFEVPARSGGGGSKWGVWRLIRYSLVNIASFSYVPLILLGWLGLFMALVSGVVGLVSMVRWAAGDSLPGFPTVILLISFVGGVLLVNMSLVGYYIAMLLGEVRRRPRFIILEKGGE